MDTMPFGRYRGRPLRDLPDSYLDWLLSLADLREPLRARVEAEAARRAGAARGTAALRGPLGAVADRIVARGYRALAAEAHPDHGGDHAAMVQLTAAREALVDLLRGART
jgi:hypothetical protein